VPKLLLEKRKTVGIRVPDHPVCRRLLELFSNPIISTSASLADQPISMIRMRSWIRFIT
jgi:tRNA A37 threonylcarbamoyladenosine synthetase subunit TsaC/SUA5/YrdC